MKKSVAGCFLAFLCLLGGGQEVSAAETILQYFGTPWLDIARKMPELAEAGYTSLWLPPPQKASGGLSVGFDTCDRFDLGNKYRHGLGTRYGTKTELLYLMKMAHRFGIRVYFDIIMAHTGGFMPEGEPYELNDLGFVPADFHIIRREDGSYYKMDWPDWQNEWEVLYRNPFSWDIATDWGGWNNSFGAHEGATTQKWWGVRHPNNPEYYDYDHTGTHVGFGNVTQEMLDNNPDGYKEEVNDFLMRAVRWFVDETKCDGFRLDAVKHVRADFFGANGENKDESDFGYGGQINRQFNRTHGYSDANHRDSCFSVDQPRDDAMLFGEHLGSPPSEYDYLDRGMRIGNDNYLNAMSGIGDSLAGMAQRGYGIYGGEPHNVVHYVMSHDNNYLWGGNRAQAFQILLAREGLPIVYTDGYNQSGEPDWFPKPSEVPFLGQFGQKWITSMLFMRRHFGWGGHWTVWDAWDKAAWVRGYGNNSAGASMAFVQIKNWSGGRDVYVAAPFNPGDIVYQYGWWGRERRRVVDADGQPQFRTWGYDPIWVGEGDYAVFSYRIPEMPEVWGDGDWPAADVRPITIFQNGERAERIWVPRQDGRDGDPGFNPYGLPDENTEDYTYYMPVPRVTSSSNLTFVARADGTVANILMKLDGGIDLNAQIWPGEGRNVDTGARDNPPALSGDMYLGYEQTKFVHRVAEKFASVDTAYNIWGSPGASSYECEIGVSGFNLANPDTTQNDWLPTYGPRFLFHEPTAQTQEKAGGDVLQFLPVPQSAANTPIDVRVKVGSQGHAEKVYLYYTTDGETWPEGSAGYGKDNTKVVEFGWEYNQFEDWTNDWWKATIPAQTAGTKVRYKIGGLRLDIGELFPYSEFNIDLAKRMETMFFVTNFNAGTIEYFPHNNWNTDQLETGLKEGFHVLRTKNFLGRGEGDFPLFREYVQTFYYDTERPTGYIVYPDSDGQTVGGSYGFVVRSDITVTEVWYQVEDANGTRPWAKAYRAESLEVASPQPDGSLLQEWRFDYDDIPHVTGNATVTVLLREISSATDLDLSEEAGHYTKLVRTMFTGTGDRIFVHSPAVGSTVGPGSNLVAWLTKSLWDGISQEEQLACFSLEINGAAYPDVAKSLEYDASYDEHAITFTLPNIYNGDPNYSHTLKVAYERGATNLVAQRQVYAAPLADGFSTWLATKGLPANTQKTDAIPGHAAGYTYEQAYIANTDPHNTEDFVWLDAEQQTSAGVEFLMRLHRTYHLMGTDSLVVTNWQPVLGPLSGDGGTRHYPIPGDVESKFYRLRVTLPQ